MKKDPLIERIAQAFGYTYATAAKKIAENANARHIRPHTLAKEIIAKATNAGPRQLANLSVVRGDTPPPAESPAAQATYDATIALAKHVRRSLRADATKTDCHIDGHPCKRAANCKMRPLDVCANYAIAIGDRFTRRACVQCARHRNDTCPGFSCYLQPGRPKHPTIIARLRKNP